MPRFSEVINNFINGEVSPKIYGRMDSEIYKRSCRTLKNMIPHPQGGASRRPGTLRLAEAVHDTNGDFIPLVDGARCFPFSFSPTEKYIIIFNKYQDGSNDNVIHYYRVDNERWNWANDAAGAPLSLSGPVTARSSTSISSYAEDDSLQSSTVIEELQYVQVGAYMIFTHDDVPPFVIARTAEGTLTPGSYFNQYTAAASTDFGPMPFMDLNVSDVTMTVTLSASANVAIGAGRVITASAAIFNAGHVGTQFCFSDSGVVGVAVVTGYTSSTEVTVETTTTLPTVAGTGTKNWYEGAWSDYRGWPRACGFRDGALFFGGSATFPDRVWRSQTFDIFEMSNPKTQGVGNPSAADPIYGDISVSLNGVSRINWLASGKRDLLVGTAYGEISISVFEKDNVSVVPQTAAGTERVQPSYVGDVPVYVQRGFRKLREFIFDDRSQGYVSPEISLLAEHMPRLGQTEISNSSLSPKIKQMAYQNLDNGILWVIDNNGFLFGCTRDRENTVTAFHRHDVAGQVKSICALPSLDGTFDELYMIVERTVNSLTEYYLERLTNEFYETTLNNSGGTRPRLPLFSDSGTVFQRPDTPNFWVQLKDGIDADISDGTATGTETGTITYEYDTAVFDGSSYVVYDGTSNADVAQVGCIRCWVELTASNTIFSISQSAASANNLIRLRTNSGILHLTINDSAGSAIINDVAFGSAWSGKGPSLVEVDFDITTGATRVFINGFQQGSTDTSTGTRNTTIDNIVIGAQYDGSDPHAGYLKDFAIFDTVQHTANYEMLNFLPLGVKLYKLDDLEGETVQVTADGNYVGDFVVSGGEIADIGSDYTASTVIAVGLAYTSILEIQPIDLGSGIGSSMGGIKRVDQANIRFRATAAASVGPDVDNLEAQVFRDDATALTDPIVLVTDDKKVDFRGGYSKTARLVVQTVDPLPMNITCITARGVTADI